MSGDIGEFDLEGFVLDKPIFISNFLLFTANLIEMDEKSYETWICNSRSPRCLYHPCHKGLERFGLSKEWALAFGDGYGYVRTGWFGLPAGTEEQQMLFSRTFFTFGKVFNWDFDSSLVKTRFKTVLETFTRW